MIHGLLGFRAAACLLLGSFHLLLGSFQTFGQNTTKSNSTLKQASETAITTVTIGTALQTGVKHLGINLAGQTFYDSGQMLRNLISRNPGFEGETWQSIVQCKSIATARCTTADQYAVWPADFLKGAAFELISGSSRGGSGKIFSNTPAASGIGPTLLFTAKSTQPAVGDFLLLHAIFPGNADTGWWTNLQGGAAVATEFHDLPPGTLGHQALRINADRPGQNASISSYFDSSANHSFVHLHGTQRLCFRAKHLGGDSDITVSFSRLDTVHGTKSFFSRKITLSPSWQTYSFDFPANESASALGTLHLSFLLEKTSILLDDVFLGAATSANNNPTAFRDEVVQTLRDLKPGVLRYMDSGTNFGSSLDNMLIPAFGRQRAGASTQKTLEEDIPLGLHEFLVLCATVGTEPWYAMPPGTSASEARSLIEYFAGGTTTAYGSRRAALGQQTPWTKVFHNIHLELGNEQWNYSSFAGSTLNDPVAYGMRASEIFSAMRSAPAYNAASFDLILGSWNAVPWWTQEELKASTAHDSVAIAPYLFNNFFDASSTDAVFGPMLAQPEALDSIATGLVSQQAGVVRTAPHPAKLAVYEVNLSTIAGAVSQAELDRTVPSLGAGLAAVDHMLLMLRDAGVTTQALFALPEYANDFTTASGCHLKVPLWGAVVDMGGSSNLRRPSFLAMQLANDAILPTMLRTTLSGANPIWNQPLSLNDKVQLNGAHLIQTFAFANGRQRSLILLNLSRGQTLSVAFSGSDAPAGSVIQHRLTAKHITDNNEHGSNVVIGKAVLPSFQPALPYALPPFSMTTLTWQTAP